MKLFWGKRNNPNAEENIAKLLITWRETNRPVIHIQHLSLLPDSPLRSGYSGSEIKDIVKPQYGDIIVLSIVHFGTGSTKTCYRSKH